MYFTTKAVELVHTDVELFNGKPLDSRDPIRAILVYVEPHPAQRNPTFWLVDWNRPVNAGHNDDLPRMR